MSLVVSGLHSSQHDPIRTPEVDGRIHIPVSLYFILLSSVYFGEYLRMSVSLCVSSLNYIMYRECEVSLGSLSVEVTDRAQEWPRYYIAKLTGVTGQQSARSKDCLRGCKGLATHVLWTECDRRPFPLRRGSSESEDGTSGPK